MLKIYQSNQIDFLLKKICKKVMLNQSQEIFPEETFLTQNFYTKKWLEIYISKHNEVNINNKFFIISKFCINLLKLTNKHNQSLSIFNVEHLQWILMSIVHDKDECFFLKKTGILFNNFEFCSHMANTFIQYILFQPNLIYQWESQKESNFEKKKHYWQKKLWILVIKRIKFLKQKNLTETVNSFLKAIKKNRNLKKIPKKILILTHIPIDPLIYAILYSIRKISAIYLFQHQWNVKEDKKIKNLYFFFKKSTLILFEEKKKLDIIKKKNIFNQKNKRKMLYILQSDLFNNKLDTIKFKKKKKLMIILLLYINALHTKKKLNKYMSISNIYAKKINI